MRALLTVSKEGQGTAIVERRYALDDEVEAMIALGVVNALAEHVGQDGAGVVFSANQPMTPDVVVALRDSVRQRYIGFGVPSTRDDRGNYLTPEQSGQFESAVFWLTQPRRREAAMDATDTSVAAVAGGLLMRNVLETLATDARKAGRAALGYLQKELTGAAIERHGFPPTILSYSPVLNPQPPEAMMAHVVLSASPFAELR
jgi:hypothetical protein